MQSETGENPHLKNKFVNMNYVANQCTMGPPLYTGSSSMDLNHCASKILKKKSRNFQKAKLKFEVHWQLFTLHLHCIYNYLCRICIVLGIVSNIEMI